MCGREKQGEWQVRWQGRCSSVETILGYVSEEKYTADAGFDMIHG